MLLAAESATTLPCRQAFQRGISAKRWGARRLPSRGCITHTVRKVHIIHMSLTEPTPSRSRWLSKIESKMQDLSKSVHVEGDVTATTATTATSEDFSLSGRSDSGYESLVRPGRTSSFCRLRGVVELVKWGKEQVFDDVPSAMTIAFDSLRNEKPRQLQIDHVAFHHPSTGAPTTLRDALLPNLNPVLSRNSFARTQWNGATYGPNSTSPSLASCFTRTFEHETSLVLSSDNGTGPVAQDARFQAEAEIVHHITAVPLEGPAFNTGHIATIGYKDYIESMWADPDGDGKWLGCTEIRDAVWGLTDGKLQLTLVSLPDTGCIWGDDGSVIEADVFEEVFLHIHKLSRNESRALLGRGPVMWNEVAANQSRLHPNRLAVTSVAARERMGRDPLCEMRAQ